MTPAAAFLTTAAALWALALLLFATVTMWLSYGLIKRDAPLILSNIVAVLSIGAILVAKLRWGRR